MSAKLRHPTKSLHGPRARTEPSMDWPSICEPVSTQNSISLSAQGCTSEGKGEKQHVVHHVEDDPAPQPPRQQDEEPA